MYKTVAKQTRSESIKMVVCIIGVLVCAAALVLLPGCGKDNPMKSEEEPVKDQMAMPDLPVAVAPEVAITGPMEVSQGSTGIFGLSVTESGNYDEIEKVRWTKIDKESTGGGALINDRSQFPDGNVTYSVPMNADIGKVVLHVRVDVSGKGVNARIADGTTDDGRGPISSAKYEFMVVD